MIHKVKQGVLDTDHPIEVGDTVYMGRYPTASAHSWASVEWRVLAKEKDQYLLITTHCIDWREYHMLSSTTWAHCDLRYDLQSMAEAMFTPKELEAIQLTCVQTSHRLIRTDEDQAEMEETPDQGGDSADQLFLLSIYEAAKYFADDKDRKCAGTPYAVERGCYNNGEQNGACWWLRHWGYEMTSAADVLPWGEICGTGDDVNEAGGVRPAMWVRFPTN